MVARPVILVVVIALGLMSHSAQAQDQYALDYQVQGEVAGQVSDPVVDDGAAMAVGMGMPATVSPISPPTLAYNYYYPTPGTGQVPARLYLCPRPTPAHVGYTYITYQALAPHEFLWRHRAGYVSMYNGGMTVTTVRWK